MIHLAGSCLGGKDASNFVGSILKIILNFKLFKDKDFI